MGCHTHIWELLCNVIRDPPGPDPTGSECHYYLLYDGQWPAVPFKYLLDFIFIDFELSSVRVPLDYIFRFSLPEARDPSITSN